MAKQKTLALHIQIDGKRRYISVPAGRANNLHTYLRSKNVRSSPPEPAYSGVDYIELAADIDVDRVQALLDDWF
jgi:hypothetical protein